MFRLSCRTDTMISIVLLLSAIHLLICAGLPFWSCERSIILENNSEHEKEWARVVVDAVNEQTNVTRGNYFKLYTIEKLATIKKSCKTKAFFGVVVAETECLKPRIITPKTDSHCPHKKEPKFVQGNITVKENNGKPVKVFLASPLVVVYKVRKIA
ncbi:hypothetical protein M514_04694 [Trichuris suis]|uniref:Cystatin domain-containing protein n=1 Tax=Trichuris suis TaxID=68888 RepID=A0A085MAV5_9BILA|nr:hypothetical protein M513_04694 [Trichuris suis]KFD65826.1 hypothetical protein M514_04694 [Trichuris suis]